MTSPAHANPNSTLWKSEPAMVAAAALWLVTNVGQVVIGHQWLTPSQWNGMTATLIGIVSFVLFAIAGWVVRKVVAPAWKLVEAEAKLAGITLAEPQIATVQPLQQVTASPLAGQPPSSTPAEATAAVVDAMPAPALDGLPVAGDDLPDPSALGATSAT